ncbi:MAG: stage II sporulation protein P [Bacillota bacterium]
MAETKDLGRIYRRALPCWVALAALVAVVRVARPAGAELPRRGRFRTGLEALTVVRAIAERPHALGQVMLCLGIPTLARRAGEEDTLFRTDLNWVELFWRLAAGVRYTTPQETFRAGLRFLGFRPLAAVPRLVIRKEENSPPREDPAPPTPTRSETPRGTVILFHTHTSESYLPISGRDHFTNGVGDIVRVGDYLAWNLEAEGFRVVHDRTIHDQVPFREAYRRSLVTMEKLLAAYPDPVALLDIHRDATPGVVSTVELGGERVARLVLVVGTDRLGLPHPRWRENLAFANRLRDAAERLYPGLLARIDVAEARYNQHLFSRALIVEIGDQYSTTAEVYRAAACLAKILAEVAGEVQPAAAKAEVPAAPPPRPSAE